MHDSIALNLSKQPEDSVRTRAGDIQQSRGRARQRARSIASVLAALAAASLAGCAGFNTLTSEVSTYGTWPADRKAASYSFERLPSQAAKPEAQQQLEAAAAPALAAAGFSPETTPGTAEYTVQIGARVDPTERSPFDDPLWWRSGFRWGPFAGPYARGQYTSMGWRYYGAPPSYSREVGVLIRDRKTGTPLFEARASNDGVSPSIEALLPAMFAAALKDFPASGANPREVQTPLAR